MWSNILFLSPFFACFFWACILFLDRKRNNRVQNLWMIQSALTAIICGFWGCYLLGVMNRSDLNILENLETLAGLFYFPVFYFFFRGLTGDLLRPKDYAWFFPPILVVGVNICILGTMGNERATAFVLAVNEYKSTNLLPTTGFEVLKWLYMDLPHWLGKIQFACLSIYLIRIFFFKRKQMSVIFLGGMLKGHSKAVGVIFGLAVLLLIIGSPDHLYYKERARMISLLIFLVGLAEFYVSYHIYHLKCSPEGVARAAEELQPVLREELPESGFDDESDREIWKGKYRELAKTIDRLMVEEKIYLQHDLRLNDIARMLNTNRTYVSRAIGEAFGCSFSSYINRLRIEYAQKLMRDLPWMSQELIAEKSGFVHVSVFARAFKECTGMTFREWRKSTPSKAE